ncbi:uncharacterized protein SAPINGB_P004911 [Magnusiomyces paraingens]|uniref:Methyltransferase domain-containing protein n=1 Tax=Magnusiomyces paraingens TaxID=2606893 RepID=A0A5E8BYT6_9ASCO|nr:uncharacterized protein SAPINGB_P004911 [Saprochaete ingens]VVT56242.1 unnamed protein product [Saprochaete ingens]
MAHQRLPAGALRASALLRVTKKPLFKLLQPSSTSSLFFSTSCIRNFAQQQSPHRRSRPQAPPKDSSLSDRYNQLKLAWRSLNEHPRFRTGASVFLIMLYAAAAYAGVQYLSDTKYKATGEPNPYKKREDVERERLNTTSIKDIASESGIDTLTDKDGGADDTTAPTSGKPGIPAPRDTTEIFDQMAREYDDKIWLEELTSHIWYRRRQVMKNVEGDVLEVSCGTGRNISYFDPERITSVTFMDSSRSMLEVAREKFTEKFPTYEHVQYVRGRAEDLAKMAAGSGQKFDTIYETFGLCSHEDPSAALRNFEALLRKNGRIVLLEHGRSTYNSLNETMDKKAEQRVKEWGCRWNLDIDQIVQSSGLEVVESDRYHFGSTYFYILKRAGDN